MAVNLLGRSSGSRQAAASIASSVTFLNNLLNGLPPIVVYLSIVLIFEASRVLLGVPHQSRVVAIVCDVCT